MKRILTIFLFSVLPTTALPTTVNERGYSNSEWIDIGKMTVEECLNKGFSALDKSIYIRKITRNKNLVSGLNQGRGGLSAASIGCKKIDTTTWVHFSVIGSRSQYNRAFLPELVGQIKSEYQ